MAKGKGFAMLTDQGPCPCGGGSYQSCCAPLHRGEQRASTAEQLMRSRYAAFVKGELEYLLATHPEADVLEAERRQQRIPRVVGVLVEPRDLLSDLSVREAPLPHRRPACDPPRIRFQAQVFKNPSRRRPSPSSVL